MEVKAVAKYIKVQPRKVRIVANEVRGKAAQQMVDVLRFHPSKGAFYLRKVIVSAMANAQENHSVNPENLRISAIMVDEGPKTKRIIARAMGRANRILKKTSHITVVVEEYEPAGAVKPHGTKAKSRPKFEAPKAKKGKKDAEAAAPSAPVEEAVTDEAAVEPEATTEEAPIEETVTEEATAAEPETADAEAAEENKEGDA